MTFSSHAHRRAAASAKSLASSFLSSHTTPINPHTLKFSSHAYSTCLSPCSSSPAPGLPYSSAQLGYGTEVDLPQAYLASSGFARRTARLSPRSFMLACRTGSRLCRSSLSLRSHPRHSSTVAEAASVYVPQDSINYAELDSEPLTSPTSASIPEEAQYVELVLHDSGSGTSRSQTQKAESASPDRTLRINTQIAPKSEASKQSHDAVGRLGSRQGLARHGTKNELTWEHILDYLDKRTENRRPDYRHVNIQGPKGQLSDIYHYLLHNPRHNIDVDYPALDLAADVGRLTLKGHPHDLQRTLEYVQKRWHHDLHIPYVRDRDTGKKVLQIVDHPNSQDTYQTSRPVLRFVSPARRPEDVRIPTSWTISSFAQYVQELIHARSPEGLRLGKSAQQLRETSLLDLLSSPEMRPFLSYAAFYYVLSFLMRHERLNQAWTVIELMKSLDMHPGAAFYDIMLLNAATHQDIQAFDRLLTTMRTDGVEPDAGTWVSLLMASSNVEFKQTVMRKMYDNGLSTHSVFATQTAPMIIPYSLQSFLGTSGDVAEFLEILDECWGPGWITDEAICQIVDVLGSRGTILDAVHLIDKLARTRDYRISKAPLHILLKHCQRTESVDLAVWLINYASRVWRLSVKDRAIFMTMFKLAYDARMYNVARVVWKYASTAGQLGSAMRNKVFQSLQARCEPDLDSVNGRWKSSIGVVACGIDPVGSQLSPDGIMDQQFAEFEILMPKMSFATTLVQALFLDKDWTQQKVKKTRGTTWKMMNAIRIEMKPVLRTRGRRLSLSTQSRTYGPVRRQRRTQRASTLYRRTSQTRSSRGRK